MKHLFTLLLLFSYFCPAQVLELDVVTEHWPPYIIDTKPITGTVTKKVREILAYTDINYQITIYPWARSFRIAMSQPNTLIYSILRNEERAPHFHWFCPLAKGPTINLYKLSSNPLDITSLTALKKVTVGVMRDDNNHSYLLEQGFKEGINLDVSSDELTNLRQLLNGRVDAVVQAKESVKPRLKILGVSDIKLVKGFTLHNPDKTTHCMALSLGTDKKIIEQVSAGFQRWQKLQQAKLIK